MDKKLIERIAVEVAESIPIESRMAIEQFAQVFAPIFLARIDAERWKDAVAEVNSGIGAIDSDVVWLKEPPPDGTKLFLSPTIPEGMALVPIEPTKGYNGTIVEAYLDEELEKAKERITKLEWSLRDTLAFLERHSNRWDGAEGKHPNDVATTARELLKVIVPPNSNADEMNALHGERYGIDWEYQES